MSTRKLLLKFARPYPGWVLLTIVLGFSGALFNGVSTALIVPIILKIVGQEVDLKSGPPILKGIMAPFDDIPEEYRTVAMAGAIVLTIFLKNAASYASTLASSALSRMLTSDMREAGLRMLLDIDLDYYTKMKVGDLINRLGGEIARAASAIGNAVKLVILTITILVFVAILLSISWELTIAATVLLSFVTVINQYAVSRSRRYGKLLSEVSTGYSIALIETLNGIRLVKATGNEDKEFKRIKKLIRDREKADFKSQANSELITPASEVMGITSLLLIVFLSRTFFQDQISSISTVLLTYLLVLLRLLPIISQLNTLRSSFANNSSSADLVADFLRRDNKPLMENGKRVYTKLSKGIHFNHISFKYPTQDKLVIKDIDLHLPRGTTLALVGGSGAGKSTLADLLPRFYDPISGSIEIDGVDLREFDLKTLRQAMGIVSQDTFLFNDTIRNNIAYGKPDATEAEIIAATQRANAYEFITKLPQGFETLIGDRGVMLSGGQRQRLAIARALLQNPEILILDEATSALDTVSERLVQAAIDDLSRDRTTLVIAHRLSTIQKADQIAVLDQGRVVELGTHQELLQKGGYYTRLYSMQFSESAEAATKRQQSSIRVCHEIRTRLNSTIGFLRLLQDDSAETNQERQELIEESYKSAFRVLNTVDLFEDVVHLQMKLQSQSHHDENNSKLTTISEDFRDLLNPMVSSLRMLADDLVDTPQKQNELIEKAFHSAMNMLDTLEGFEERVKV